MLKHVLLAAFVSTLLISCSDTTTTPGDDRSQLEQQVVANYSAIVLASYNDALTGAQTLRVALKSFTDNPTQQTHEAAKLAYIAARTPYLQTEAYRLYGGPIDDANGPEGLINGWPMDESYVDYIKDNPNAGIINRPDLYPTINKALIESLNESGGETNISCGFHAIEFLLWGQDFSLTTPGMRSFTDYIVSSSGPGMNAQRRADYLLAAADLLIDNITYVRNTWNPGVGSYYETFNADPKKAVELLLTGLVRFNLGELAGERMEVAFTSADQEDEHSCFSDLTDMDIQFDQQGIVNVLTGSYKKSNGETVQGKGVLDLIQYMDMGTANKLREAATASTAACAQIMNPFDNELVDPAGRQRVQNAIKALRLQGGALQDGALKLGYTLSGELPE